MIASAAAAAILEALVERKTIGSKVILRGTVRSWWQKEAAGRVAWQAPGVTQVENQIEVVV